MWYLPRYTSFNPQWVQLDIKRQSRTGFRIRGESFNPQWVQLDIKTPKDSLKAISQKRFQSSMSAIRYKGLGNFKEMQIVVMSFNPQWVQLDIKAITSGTGQPASAAFQSSMSAIRYKEYLWKPLSGKGSKREIEGSLKNQRCQRTMSWFYFWTASVSYVKRMR